MNPKEETMEASKEMQDAVEALSKLHGYICHGLVNYSKGVSALQEHSDPDDQANYFPQQCTAIIRTLKTSLENLKGGTPDKLLVESSQMTMMIYPVDDTYFCGVGLMPGTPTDKASVLLDDLRRAFRNKLGK
jgi:predicted regulator of Ras-like GTPase activity (Roadblock/LC7/MglB family)